MICSFRLEHPRFYIKATARAHFHMNLPTDFDTYNPTITSSAGIPNSKGLIFPFLLDLAREDPVSIMHLLRTKLFPCLGANRLECAHALRIIQEALPQFHMTEAGKELTHMAVGITLALDSGAQISFVSGAQGSYGGFILSGHRFSVSMRNNVFLPQSFEDLQNQYQNASPHDYALTRVFEYIHFADDMERQAARQSATSLYHVSKHIREKGYNANDREHMENHLKNVTFIGDRYLPITSDNLARVLTTMHESFGEENLPVHHLAVFETSRDRRLWSAFGAFAPSFVIEGGRKMELGGEFTFERMESGGKKTVQTSVVHVVLKELRKAWVDLERVKTEHVIWNLAGLASRASARSMVRDFGGQHGRRILGALRLYCGVEEKAEKASGSKRKRDDEEDVESAKRAREAFDF